MVSRLGPSWQWAWPLALGGCALVVAAPGGYRTGVMPLAPAFLALLGGVLLSWLALVQSLIALRRSAHSPAGRLRVVMAAGLAAATGIGPVLLLLPSLGFPAIHDITTDSGDPPRFAAVVAVRGAAANTLEYGGTAVAAAQRAAYPELAPLTVSQSPTQTLGLAREAAEAMGWEIVAVDQGAGRLEATDTTFWFGFRDDIVVRVRSAADGARVDVRSVSRVGVGDLGANAVRITSFLNRLAAAGRAPSE